MSKQRLAYKEGEGIKRKNDVLKKVLVLAVLCMAVFSHVAIVFAAPDIPIISVVLDDSYPPYSFRNNDGELQGILVDSWALWEKKTGVTVNLAGMDWNMALSEMERKRFDVIDVVLENEERARYLTFTSPYLDIDVPIFFP